MKSIDASKSVFSLGLTFLPGIESGALAHVLEKEDKQTASVVLAYLDNERSVKVFNLLPVEFAVETAMMLMDFTPVTIGELTGIQNHIIERIIRGDSSAADPGLNTVINLMRKCNLDKYDKTYQRIGKENPGIMNRIDEQMFTFDDIFSLKKSVLKKVLRSIDNMTLAKALKGLNREELYIIISVLPENEMKDIKEDIDFMGPIRKIDMLAARAEIVQVIKKLDSSGKIDLKRIVDDVNSII